MGKIVKFNADGYAVLKASPAQSRLAFSLTNPY